MGSSGHRRVTFSLPPAAVDHLDFVAGRLGCSRSALLAEVLGTVMPGLHQVAECLPENPSDATEDDVRRLRGASARVIGQQVERLLAGAQDDLFDE